jgi:hypothetical protein
LYLNYEQRHHASVHRGGRHNFIHPQPTCRAKNAGAKIFSPLHFSPYLSYTPPVIPIIAFSESHHNPPYTHAVTLHTKLYIMKNILSAITGLLLAAMVSAQAPQ